MISEKKIEEAAKKYCDEHQLFENYTKFIAGAHFAISELWPELEAAREAITDLRKMIELRCEGPMLCDRCAAFASRSLKKYDAVVNRSEE